MVNKATGVPPSNAQFVCGCLSPAAYLKKANTKE